MHFRKYPQISNFEFATAPAPGKVRTTQGSFRLAARANREGVFHLRVTGKGWEENESQTELNFTPKKPAAQGARLEAAGDHFILRDADGTVLLQSVPGRFFGQCGGASVFEFLKQKGDAFYGMGEKWTGLEHSGKITKFWNTSVWTDFHAESYVNGKPAPDPVYVSIPYLILARGGRYIGLLLDNPGATFISTGPQGSIIEQMKVSPDAEVLAAARKAGMNPEGFIHLGAESGQPSLYVLVGPTLAELTRKFQCLVGVTPRPPAWALGYQQCRWGYESEQDLLDLDASFRQHRVPVDGLWLDIDYMRGYRVFTFEAKHFLNPKAAMARLNALGRKVVPIIDPGVKWEKGYDVYERGRKAGAFCLNPQKREFIAVIWPGQTVLPDFSLATARDWWTQEVEAFAKLGIYGAWLDLNDPATGSSDNVNMLFDHGRKGHETYHNQYAAGMARATHAGFLAAHPDQRPFLLSRSGSTGIGRHTAIWTGDNFSNYHHLKNSIATTLNLALSGVPFNGADVGGFGGDTTPQLIQDWFKAGFLFPVFRNHSVINTRLQEPWAFGAKVLRVLRKFICLRYRLRPYLYQLFLAHERTGEAILRPLFYDFANTKALPLGQIDDQFLAGPALLQAPFVEENQTRRRVALPGRVKWFDVNTGTWLAGGRALTVRAERETTPLYIRDRTILPLARTAPEDHAFAAHRVDFHVFLSVPGTATTEYESDDAQTFAYQQGAYTRIAIQAKLSKGVLKITTKPLHEGATPLDFTVTTLPNVKTVTINGRAARTTKPQGVPLGTYRAVAWAV